MFGMRIRIASRTTTAIPIAFAALVAICGTQVSYCYILQFTGWFLDIIVRQHIHMNMFPWKVIFILISTSMATPYIIPEFNGLCTRRKQTKELLISFSFLLSYKTCSKWPPHSRANNSVLREFGPHQRSTISEVFFISLGNCWIWRHRSTPILTVPAWTFF
jgi:hypothetical protein